MESLRFEVLDLLGRLVEASLVTFDADVRPRYRLLETVRQYALDKLVEAGEADAARERHAAYFSEAAVVVDDRLTSADPDWMGIATDDLGNYRAAMTWAIDARRGELAVQLASDLRTYFWNRVMYRESVKWLTSALALVDDDSVSVSRGLSFALTDAQNIGDEAAVKLLQPRAERMLASSTGAPAGLLSNALAAVAMPDDIKRADQLFRDAHVALREAGSRRWTAPLQNRMLTAWLMNDASSKTEILDLVAIAESEKTNVHGDVVRTCFQMIEGDYHTVFDFVSSHVAIDEWEEAMLLTFAGHSARALGLLEDALSSIRSAHHVFRIAGVGGTFWELGMVLMQMGQLDEAVVEYTDTPAITSRTAIDRTFAAHFFSMVAEKGQDFAASAILAGYANAMGESASVRLLDFDLRLLTESQKRVERELGIDRYESLRLLGGNEEWGELPLVHR